MALDPHPKLNRRYPFPGAVVPCKRKDSVSALVLDELVLALGLDASSAFQLGMVWARVLVLVSLGWE